MLPAILNEEAGRRICMLTEYMLGKPVFESYKSLCSKIGDDTISYQEFDFWFHRFAQGKLDLSYDRSLDPKPKELSDMPIDIIENVADYFSPMDRLIVRNVSKSLRSLVENRIARYKFVAIHIGADEIEVRTDNKTENYAVCKNIVYRKQENDCLMFDDEVERLVKGADPFQLAAEHLSIVLKNPDIKLESMWLTGQEENNGEAFTGLLKSALGSTMFVVNNLKFFVTTVGALLNVLPSVVPDKLYKIETNYIWRNVGDDVKLAEIVEMDQWKNVTHFWLEHIEPVPIELVIHANHFRLNLKDVSPQEVVRIREILFKSPDFEFCFITPAAEYDPIAIQEALGPFITKIPERPELKFYAIPDSTGFLSFNFDATYFYIKKYNAEDF